tara:strand:- start:49 stop:246 length:198 start_codon:yes stop_codon:yes gene_type:complete
MTISYQFRNTVLYEMDGITVSATMQDILYKEDGVVKFSIPKDQNNRHYKQYLEWIANGNTTEESD